MGITLLYSLNEIIKKEDSTTVRNIEAAAIGIAALLFFGVIVHLGNKAGGFVQQKLPLCRFPFQRNSTQNPNGPMITAPPHPQ